MIAWNNGKDVPKWGFAEIQKMSPSTTGRCKYTREWGQPTNAMGAGHGEPPSHYSMDESLILCDHFNQVVLVLVSRFVPSFVFPQISGDLNLHVCRDT